MKLIIALVISTILIPSAYAEAGNDVTTRIIDIELNKDKKPFPEASIVVQVHEADDETDAEFEAKALDMFADENFNKADVINSVNNEAEQIKQVKVEVGADHEPANYPRFLASILTLDFSDPRINLQKIVDGGVVVDEIPPLVNPLIIPIKEAEEYLHFNDDEYMAVIEINGDARAYPLSVLNWHQGVNETIGGQPVFIAYDPLSGNIFAMDRRVAGKKETTFGVTGQVYKSSSLYYDRATKSIWSAFENMAVTGSLAGQKMKRYEAVLTTWKSYKETYPKGMVLDMMDTGYERNYRQNPYGDYAKNNQVLFSVAYAGNAFPRKEYMLGVRMFKNGRRVEVAIPINALLEYKDSKIQLAFDEVQVAGSKVIPLTVEVKQPYGSIEISTSDDEVILEKFYSFWFVWSAHNPNSRMITVLD